MIQRFSTSILTLGPDEGAFPSDLLSTKPLATAERTLGMKASLTYFVVHEYAGSPLCFF